VASRDSLRTLAPVVAAAAAAVSVALMLRAGSNGGAVLVALFCAWVLSPFAALIWLTPRRGVSRTALVVTLMVALCSLVVYGGMVPMPSGTRPAFPFLMVPLGSWVLIAIVWTGGGLRRRETGDSR
jgi:hypothetical protein